MGRSSSLPCTPLFPSSPPKINARPGAPEAPGPPSSFLFWRLLLGMSRARPAPNPHEPSYNSHGCSQTTATLI